jgi:Ca-activated chloride channel family protein
MRHTLIAAVLGTAWVLGLSPARAQEAAISTTADPVIIVPQGRHVVIWPRPTPRPPRSVTLTTVNTAVSVTDQVASTTMTMTLTNPGGAQQEAQLLVPVPDGASVRAFQLDSAGSEPTAKLLPRDEARRIYDSIVAKARDPGLLEFVGYSVIKSSVFPVPPGGTQTLRLTYEQLLSADGSAKSDRVDFVLPRTESLEQTGVNWTFSADIRSKRPISTVYSPSHEIVTERVDPNHVTVKLMIGSMAQPGAFRLSYLLPRDGDDLAASVLFYPDPDVGDGKGGYFLLLTGLPAKNPDADKALKREVTIVIDRSGSMRGPKIEQVREAALQVVEGLHEGEFFNIIDYSDSINSFSEKPVAKNDDTIKQARTYIKGIQANGGTNIHDAVIEALRPQPAAGTLPVVLFLTDGLPTVGQTSEKDIKDAAAKANAFQRRIFTFGVGYDVNAPLLRGLAVQTRASSTFVLPDENVEVKVGQVYRRLSGPILAMPKLTTSGDDAARAIREIQPASLPDLFEGDQLIVLGQYTDSKERRLTLQGNFLGKDRTFEFTFDPSKATTKNSFVPRLWASRRIAALIEQIRQNGADGHSNPATDPSSKELVDEIVRLSTKWGILTEYTAFLALEPGAMAGNVNQRLDYISVPPAGASGPRAPMEAPALRRSINADVLSGSGAPADSAPAREKAAYVVGKRAGADRDGKVAVNQEMNLGQMAAQTCENKANVFYTKDMQQVQVNSICQVGDQTLFLRSNRWVDARLLDKENEQPERVIEFASDDYNKVVDDLAAQGRQGLIAQGGDVYLLYKGQRCLVKGPGAATE